EPSVPARVASGADLISFSGDKLLGSCQAGILVGKRETIERLASHPLYRALRLSKLALSALEATLLIYRFGEPKQEIPVLRSIFAGSKAIRSRGKTFSSRARKVVEQLGYELELVESLAYVGSGASPARSMPSFSLCLSPRKSALSVEELARQLRVGTPSIWARIVEDSLLLDMRSPAPGEEKLILARLGEIAGVDGAKLTFETTEQAES
ncbi:MAG: aminotransferase class V-fold PLP-dependent enzyme, partial [Planctomycetota bacterium]